jgi:hypothetical protein
MKKYIKQIIILLFALFVLFNIYLNRQLRPFLKETAPQIDYLFALSVIPDRVTLFDFQYMNISAPVLTVDINLMNLYKKRYEKLLDGIVAYGLKMRFVKKDGARTEPKASSRAFIIPFCKYLYIINGSIEYEDIKGRYKFFISGLNGISSYNGKGESEEFMTLDLSGNILGKAGQKAYMKFFFYPYYKNKFFLNVFATGIDAKIFEPMFARNKMVFDRGRINFIVQMKGEMRKIYLNNIMEFKDVKIRENAGLDLKALFGVSVEQLADFLKDSKGDFYVNYDFSIDDSQFSDIFMLYGDSFKESIAARVRVGVLTAPLRQIKDLIWNLTGENVVRLYKLFGGK